MNVAVGFALPSTVRAHAVCRPVLEAVDYLEVVPESLVHPFDQEGFRGNGFARRVRDLQQAHGIEVVAHGIGSSLCTSHPLDTPRFDRWLDRATVLAEQLAFRWYTDHTSLTAPAGLHLSLPFDTPRTPSAAKAAHDRLGALSHRLDVPVGFENSAIYVPFADPSSEPAWIERLLDDRHVWVLDLHNLWTHVVNFGIDPHAWLDTAPLERVIEVHLSGGRPAPSAWTDGESWHLDSHDAAVPEPVWRLLTSVLPRLPRLQGVTLERLDVAQADVPVLLAEIDRIRRALADRPPVRPPSARERPSAPEAPHTDEAQRFELVVADAFAGNEPLAALRRARADTTLPDWAHRSLDVALAHPVGIGLTRRLVARQRFERLVNGSPSANAWFESAPASFAQAFRAYVDAVAPVAFFPGDEARMFDRWLRR